MAPNSAAHVTSMDVFLKSIRGQSLEASTETLISLLKRRQINGPEQCAMATAHMLRQVVAKSKWSDVDSLLDRVQRVGKRLVEARPMELVIGNIVRRVLGLIRDEAETDRNGDDFDDSVSETSAMATNSGPATGSMSSADFGTVGLQSRPATRPPVLSSAGSYYVPQSMFNLLSGTPLLDSSSPGTGSPYGRDSGILTPSLGSPIAPQTSISALRSEVIDGIDEIKDEISQVDDQIAGFAEVQIHPGDYVLVYKPNATVSRFLIGAAKRRKFTVMFLGEGLPTKTPDPARLALRKKLGASGVQCITIRGGGVMAYMSRVQKVILGARAIVSDGGVVAEGGAGLVARAAREYGTPVLVLGGVFKLCPEEQPNLDSMLEMGGASDWVDFADGDMVEGMNVQTALNDYIPPEQISVYITNLGPHSRHHLQSIIADHYKPTDIEGRMNQSV